MRLPWRRRKPWIPTPEQKAKLDAISRDFAKQRISTEEAARRIARIMDADIAMARRMRTDSDKAADADA